MPRKKTGKGDGQGSLLSTLNQTDATLEYMRQHPRGITPIDALKGFGCFRLGARIYDLKQQGHEIKCERVTTASGKRIARYSLA